MNLRAALFFLLTAFVGSCKQQTKSTLEKFREIDSSLQKTSTLLKEELYDGLYKQIQASKDLHPQAASKAGAIYLAHEKATSLLDSLQKKLLEADPSGESLDIASTLLLSKPVLASLNSRLLGVYEAAHSALPAEEKKKEAARLFPSAQEINNNRKWATHYFQMVPTAAAITLLARFKNDCEQLTLFALKEIKAAL